MLNKSLRDLVRAEAERRHPVRAFLRRLRGEQDGALNVRLDRIFPGFGVSVRQDNLLLRSGIALTTTGQQTNTVPQTPPLAVGFSAGKIRVKIYNGGGTSPTLVDLVVQAGDGTNTVLVYAFHPNAAVAITATNWFDQEIDFLVDVAASGSGGGAAGQLLPGGATQFNILTTLGGTTPTASMDVEVFGLI